MVYTTGQEDIRSEHGASHFGVSGKILALSNSPTVTNKYGDNSNPSLSFIKLAAQAI